MRLLTDHSNMKALAFCLTLMTAPVSSQGQQTNPLQYVAMQQGTYNINKSVNKQTESMLETAGLQGMMYAEFTKMRQWEEKYNGYLKTAQGYAESLKAGTTLYADGVETIRNIHLIRKAVNSNPQGIGASVFMSDIYKETAAQFVKVYKVLNESIAKGGEGNMLTGAERNELLWQLSDEMYALNKKLKRLAVSIAYYNMTDVWNRATAGMTNKSNEQLATEALARWKNASNVNAILND